MLMGDLDQGGDPAMEQDVRIQNPDNICGICDAVVSSRGLLDCCNHIFCFSCIEDWAAVTNLCPMCKAQFKFVSLVANAAVCKSIEDENDDTRANDEAFSYLIDEEAVSCLDGDECKLRCGQAIQNDLEDTSVACDGCDCWYHACCVGFDPNKPYGKTWLCPRCTNKDMEKNVEEAAFAFTETGESAIVISMASSSSSEYPSISENALISEQIPESAPLHISESSQQPTSLDKLFDLLEKQGTKRCSQVDNTEEDIEREECSQPEDIEEEFSDFKELRPEDLQEEHIEEDEFDFLKPEQEDYMESEHIPEDMEDNAADSDVTTKEISEIQTAKPDSNFSEEDKLMEIVSDKDKLMETVSDEDKLMEIVSDEDKLMEIVSDEDKLMEIVSDMKQKKVDIPKKTDNETITQPVQNNKSEGVRTRIIMRRETDDLSLAEKIRQQVNTDLPDEQLLSAYKAAMVKRDEKPKKYMVNTGRENLKRKLYGGIRGRRVYDRDWDVAFWRDKVLKEKRVNTAAKEVVNEEVRDKEEPDSILDRVCFADCSLLPRGDKDEDKAAKAAKGGEKGKGVKAERAKVSVETKPEAKDAKPEAKDKKQWALELLARKNKQQVKVQHDNLKGFVNLSQLPIDMRPILDPNPKYRVPTAVRQMHLNRFLEVYLKDTTVGRNEASVEAINDALAKENEIYAKSNSKGVYVNLCVRTLARGERPTKEKPEEPQENSTDDTVAEALVATGLVSDSPPGSPADQEEKVENADESPRKKMKYMTDVAFGKGINALLEHLRTEKDSTEKTEIQKKSDTHGQVSTDKAEAETQEQVPIKTTEKVEKTESASPSKTKEQVSKITADKNKDQTHREHIHKKMPRNVSRSQTKDNDAVVLEETKGANHSKEDDYKFTELDSRIDRVRSNIVQHLSENSNIDKNMLLSKENNTSKSSSRDKSSTKKLSVDQQVEMYVKEHIRPLYKSGVINSEQYKWTVNKTTAKVLQHHKDATSAEFLISEGPRVKKLAEQYLQRLGFVVKDRSTQRQTRKNIEFKGNGGYGDTDSMQHERPRTAL